MIKEKADSRFMCCDSSKCCMLIFCSESDADNYVKLQHKQNIVKGLVLQSFDYLTFYSTSNLL